jgi:hypothetical protein
MCLCSHDASAVLAFAADGLVNARARHSAPFLGFLIFSLCFGVFFRRLFVGALACRSSDSGAQKNLATAPAPQARTELLPTPRKIYTTRPPCTLRGTYVNHNSHISPLRGSVPFGSSVRARVAPDMCGPDCRAYFHTGSKSVRAVHSGSDGTLR